MFGFYDLFLPKKLPQEDVYDQYDISDVVEEFLSFDDHSGFEFISEPHDADSILNKINKLQLHKTSLLAIFIKQQNAGIYFEKCDNKDNLSISTYNVSPKSKDIYKFDIIQTTLPVQSVIVSNNKITKEWIEQIIILSKESMNDAVAYANKAGQQHKEQREISNPKYIHEYLLNVLNGSLHKNCKRITKKVRDCVLWNNVTVKPWRRSGCWLALKSIFHLFSGDIKYKLLMIRFMMYYLIKHEKKINDDYKYQGCVKILRRIKKFNQMFPKHNNEKQLNEVQQQIHKIQNKMCKDWNIQMMSEHKLLNIRYYETYCIKHTFIDINEHKETVSQSMHSPVTENDLWNIGDNINGENIISAEYFIMKQFDDLSRSIDIDILYNILQRYVNFGQGYYKHDPHGYSRMIMIVLMIIIMIHQYVIKTNKILSNL
eukprot:350868_1